MSRTEQRIVPGGEKCGHELLCEGAQFIVQLRRQRCGVLDCLRRRSDLEVREELVLDLLRLRLALPFLAAVRFMCLPVGFLTVGALQN